MIFLGYKVVWFLLMMAGYGDAEGSIPVSAVCLTSWMVLSWLAFQGKKRAQWILGLLIFLHFYLLVRGLVFVPMAEPFLKLSSIVFGIFFAFGGIIMVNHSKGAGSKFLITADNIRSGFSKK